MTSVVRGSDNFDTAHAVPQDLTASRAFNTFYTAGTRARLVMVSGNGGTGSDTYIEARIQTGATQTILQVCRTNEIDSTGNWRAMSNGLTFYVPPGYDYRVVTSGGTPALVRWAEVELR